MSLSTTSHLAIRSFLRLRLASPDAFSEHSETLQQGGNGIIMLTGLSREDTNMYPDGTGCMVNAPFGQGKGLQQTTPASGLFVQLSRGYGTSLKGP